MSVRKRTWTTRKGEAREAWIVQYSDQDGIDRIKTFARKKEADDYHDTVKVDVRQGVHTPHSKSITVAEAGTIGSPTPSWKGESGRQFRVIKLTSICTSARAWGGSGWPGSRPRASMRSVMTY